MGISVTASVLIMMCYIGIGDA
eukprot:COSAG01_NODE_15904_length_1286_cov_16.262005_1_plen_21_part_10